MDEKEILKKLEELEKRQKRTEAGTEIRNLVGRYAQLHAVGRDKQILRELWSERADASVEDRWSSVHLMQGRVTGIREFFENQYGMPGENGPEVREERGRMHVDTVNSLVLEIREDLQEARASWMSAGCESRRMQDPADPGKKKLRAFWVWSRVEAEFVPEGGKWKILHLHIRDLFRCPFEKSWVEYGAERMKDEELLDTMMRSGTPGLLPSYPSEDFWEYSPDSGMPSTAGVAAEYDEQMKKDEKK